MVKFSKLTFNMALQEHPEVSSLASFTRRWEERVSLWTRRRRLGESGFSLSKNHKSKTRLHPHLLFTFLIRISFHYYTRTTFIKRNCTGVKKRNGPTVVQTALYIDRLILFHPLINMPADEELSRKV